MFDTEFTVTVLTQVIFFFIFITIFFFTYAALTEKSIVINQIEYLVDQTIGPYVDFLCKTNDCSQLKQKINEIDPSMLKNEDQETADSNKKIIQTTIIVLIITCIAVFGIIFILFKTSNNKSGFFKSFDMKKIIFNSALILLFVGITEFTFLTFFGKRFISVDVNKVKIAILEKINGIGK